VSGKGFTFVSLHCGKRFIKLENRDTM